MAEDTQTTEQTATEQVTDSGGIITRTDGGPSAPSVTGWRSELSPELQAEKSLESFKDVGALAKSFVETKKLVGKGIDYPGADAKPEQVAEFRKRAGIPDSPDKYELTLPKPPEGSGMEWDQKWLGTLKGRLHAAHARPQVVQAVVDTFSEYMAQHWDRWRSQQADSEQEDLTGAIAELEQKWGPRGGPMWKHHSARAETAIRILMADSPPAAVQRVVESANDPEVAHAFSLMADSLIERGYLGEDELPSALGAEDAQRKADEIREAAVKDPKHPLNDPNHPDHERVVKQFVEYNAVAAGPRGREVVASVQR